MTPGSTPIEDLIPGSNVDMKDARELDETDFTAIVLQLKEVEEGLMEGIFGAAQGPEAIFQYIGERVFDVAENKIAEAEDFGMSIDEDYLFGGTVRIQCDELTIGENVLSDLSITLVFTSEGSVDTETVAQNLEVTITGKLNEDEVGFSITGPILFEEIEEPENIEETIQMIGDYLEFDGITPEEFEAIANGFDVSGLLAGKSNVRVDITDASLNTRFNFKDDKHPEYGILLQVSVIAQFNTSIEASVNAGAVSVTVKSLNASIAADDLFTVRTAIKNLEGAMNPGFDITKAKVEEISCEVIALPTLDNIRASFKIRKFDGKPAGLVPTSVIAVESIEAKLEYSDLAAVAASISDISIIGIEKEVPLVSLDGGAAVRFGVMTAGVNLEVDANVPKFDKAVAVLNGQPVDPTSLFDFIDEFVESIKSEEEAE